MAETTMPMTKRAMLKVIEQTQGKKHQSNLARRAAKEAADAPVQPAPQKQVKMTFDFCKSSDDHFLIRT